MKQQRRMYTKRRKGPQNKEIETAAMIPCGDIEYRDMLRIVK